MIMTSGSSVTYMLPIIFLDVLCSFFYDMLTVPFLWVEES
jgi:hypothetical protein